MGTPPTSRSSTACTSSLGPYRTAARSSAIARAASGVCSSVGGRPSAAIRSRYARACGSIAIALISRPVVGEVDERPPVVDQREQAVGDPALAHLADEHPVVAGLDRLAGHAGGVRGRVLVQDRAALGQLGPPPGDALELP